MVLVVRVAVWCYDLCVRVDFFSFTFTFILYTRENQQDTSVLVKGVYGFQRSPVSA